ncbi:MAG: anti-sigma factor family protein [Planctomycetota bacterium]|jgi:hypothetical protein
MSQIHKNVDELLSCYIDGELSDRERTKVKRLVQHDKNVATKLADMQKQKQLLNSLPVVKAPEGLLQSINISLNAKPSTDKYFIDTNHSAGAKHLLLRRVLSAAAIFVLAGALALVVFNVIAPGSASRKTVAFAPPADGPANQAQATETIVASAPAGTEPASESYTFSAALELVTYDSIAVNSHIAKVIYNNRLVDNTIPRRQATSSTYHITCTAEQVVTLMGDLDAVWDKCNNTSLKVHDEIASADIKIDNITSAQAINIFAPDKYTEQIKMARNFADFNTLIRNSGASSDLALSTPTENREFVPSVPIKPELTRTEQQPAPTENTQERQNINLIITVTGL